MKKQLRTYDFTEALITDAMPLTESDLEEAKQIDTHDPRSHAVQFELGDYNNKGDLKLHAQKVDVDIRGRQMWKNINELIVKFNAKYGQDEKGLLAKFGTQIQNCRENGDDTINYRIILSLYQLALEISDGRVEPQAVANMSYDYLISNCASDKNVPADSAVIQFVIEQKYKDICDHLINNCHKIAADYKEVYEALNELRQNPEFRNSANYVDRLPYMDDSVSEEPTEDELLANEEQAMKDYQAEKERKRLELERARKERDANRTLFDYDQDVTEAVDNELDPFNIEWRDNELNDDNYVLEDEDDYPTVLYLGQDEEVIGRNAALRKILQAIDNIKTPEEYNNFSINWFDYEDDEEGDVVVSIYSAKEIEEADIFGDADVEEKCSCGNDGDAWEQIQQALAAKQKELLNK